MTLRLARTAYAATPKGFGPTLTAPRLIVVHDTSNTATAEAEAHYAATRTDDRGDWTSAHFYVDATGVVGSVPLDQRAWAAPPVNGESWSVELCGWNGSIDPVTIARGAALVAKLARLGGIPLVHVTGTDLRTARGVCGHADVNALWHQSTHTDPGPTFPWSRFLSIAQAAEHPPATVRRGSTGATVGMAQELLNVAGAHLSMDGVFGPLTEAAVRAYQARVRITVDGVVGPVTWTHLLYV